MQGMQWSIEMGRTMRQIARHALESGRERPKKARKGERERERKEKNDDC